MKYQPRLASLGDNHRNAGVHTTYPALIQSVATDVIDLIGRIDMVKTRPGSKTAPDMGQSSSQLGPPSTQPPSGGPRSSKTKKSKSKAAKDDAGTEARPAADEEESARALIQLSGAALESVPFYDKTDQDVAPVQSETAQHDGSASAEGEDSRPGKKKKTTKKKERRNGTVHEPEHAEDHGMNSLNGTDGLQDPLTSSPPELAELELTQSMHPLDNESSDNELVQEYERGASDFKQHTQRAEVADMLGTGHRPQEVDQEADTHKRVKNGRRTQKERRSSLKAGEKKSRKRKRKTGDDDADAAPGWSNVAGRLTPELMYSAWGNVFGEQTSSADVNGHAHIDDMPIDPELHSIGAMPASQLNNDKRTPGAQNKRKRKEHPAEHGQGQDYDASGSMDQENGFGGDYTQDQVIRGLEDEKYNLSETIGTAYTEDTDIEELRQHQKTSKKKSRRKPHDSVGNRSTFTTAEQHGLDRFKRQYLEENNMSSSQFNNYIQANIRGNVRATEIYDRIYEQLPDKTRPSVQKFCRRHFHNFHARGIWTPEEDEELKLAIASKGTSAWKVVGSMLDRFGEDCRDRYRNYLAPSAAHRNREGWTEGEVINLSQSILDCMQRMKDERDKRIYGEDYVGQDSAGALLSGTEDVDSKKDLENINWQIVSEGMSMYGTPRSRLQCSFKWAKIKEDDKYRYLTDVARARVNRQQIEGDYTANNLKRSHGWRLKKSARKAANMKSGDRYDLLRFILDSQVLDEGNIPWGTLGDDQFKQRWTTYERRAGWLQLKEEIPGAEEMNYRQIAEQHMAHLYATDWTTYWDPEIHGYVEESPAAVQKSKARSQGKKLKKKKRMKKEDDGNDGSKDDTNTLARNGPISAEFVHSSDDNDDDENNNNNDHNKAVQASRGRLIDNLDDRMNGDFHTGAPEASVTAAATGEDRLEQPHDHNSRERARSNVSLGSLFDGPTSSDDGQSSPAYDRAARSEVSPELASRVALLQDA